MVVVGGGLAGSLVAKKLKATFHVTVIDVRPHFVCLPSMPECVCRTDKLEKFVVAHSHVHALSLPPHALIVLTV